MQIIYLLAIRLVCSIFHSQKNSLGNPSKDRQRFVDAFVLISAPDWLNRLSNFENVIKTQFDPVLRM